MAKCVSKGSLAWTLTPGDRKDDATQAAIAEAFAVPAECALEMRPKAMSDAEAMRYDTPVLHHSDSG